MKHSIVRVAGYNSAQLAGDSRNTRHILYPGSVKAVLHSTTCAVCKPRHTTTWLLQHGQQEEVKNVATRDVLDTTIHDYGMH